MLHWVGRYALPPGPRQLTNLYLKIAPLAGTAPPKACDRELYGSTEHIADRYAPRSVESCHAPNIPDNHDSPVQIRFVSSTTLSDAFMTLTTVLLRTCRGSSPHDLFSPLARNRLAGIGRRSKSSSTAAEKPTSPSPRADSPSLKPFKSSKGQGEKVAPDPIDVPTQLWYQRLGPVTDAVRWFHKTQQKRPYTVQVATSLTVYLVGDLLAQDIGGEQYESGRTLRMLTIGAIASIPGYKWFLFLGNHFNYPSRILSIATKVVVQQIVFTPIFNTYFFGMQAILTGEPPSGVIDRIAKAVPISMWNSVKLWPAVTAFSFAFIMPQYRFMFSGVFAVIWQTYLSFLNRREEKEARAIGTL